MGSSTLKRWPGLMVVVCCFWLGLSSAALGDPVSSYDIPESQLITLSELHIAGDILVLDAGGSISDVFRIFNNVVDTGRGTGLGNQVFLFSLDEGNLPSPSTYSANFVSVMEGPAVNGVTETDINSNGTIFRLFSPNAVPEGGSTAVLLLIGVMGVGLALFVERFWPNDSRRGNRSIP